MAQAYALKDFINVPDIVGIVDYDGVKVLDADVRDTGGNVSSLSAWMATVTSLNSTFTGLTATVTELNYLDITTLGTGAASKAVVLDSGEDYTWPATGVLTYGVLSL